MKEPLILPEGSGPPVIHSEKVYVPVKEHPDVSSKLQRHSALISNYSSEWKNSTYHGKKSNFTAYLSQKSKISRNEAKVDILRLFLPWCHILFCRGNEWVKKRQLQIGLIKEFLNCTCDLSFCPGEIRLRFVSPTLESIGECNLWHHQTIKPNSAKPRTFFLAICFWRTACCFSIVNGSKIDFYFIVLPKFLIPSGLGLSV